MNMRKTCAASLLLLSTLSGCSSMVVHFDKGRAVQNTTVTEHWHHNFVFALYEASPPVNLKEECGDMSWVSVGTHLSFVNGLASFALNTLFGPIWYPRTVTVSCK
jgi:hypothetical protein